MGLEPVDGAQNEDLQLRLGFGIEQPPDLEYLPSTASGKMGAMIEKKLLVD